MLSGIWSWGWSVEALPREGGFLLITLALSGFRSLLDEAIRVGLQLLAVCPKAQS